MWDGLSYTEDVSVLLIFILLISVWPWLDIETTQADTILWSVVGLALFKLYLEYTIVHLLSCLLEQIHLICTFLLHSQVIFFDLPICDPSSALCLPCMNFISTPPHPLYTRTKLFSYNFIGTFSCLLSILLGFSWAFCICLPSQWLDVWLGFAGSSDDSVVLHVFITLLHREEEVEIERF